MMTIRLSGQFSAPLTHTEKVLQESVMIANALPWRFVNCTHSPCSTVCTVQCTAKIRFPPRSFAAPATVQFNSAGKQDSPLLKTGNWETQEPVLMGVGHIVKNPHCHNGEKTHRRKSDNMSHIGEFSFTGVVTSANFLKHIQHWRGGMVQVCKNIPPVHKVKKLTITIPIL